MEIKTVLHSHAITRLRERFGVDELWILNQLEQGKFVWLNGAGGGLKMKKNGPLECTRFGHLIYIPQVDEYCVIVIDGKDRMVITALTESMAIKSSWSKKLNPINKLRAKKLSLGDENIGDVNFLYLKASEREEIVVTVKIKTVLYENWKPIVISLCKLAITADQLDTTNNYCSLTRKQMQEVEMLVNQKLTEKIIYPFGELIVSNKKSYTVPVSNKLSIISAIEEADSVRRWL